MNSVNILCYIQFEILVYGCKKPAKTSAHATFGPRRNNVALGYGCAIDPDWLPTV